ncbi:MAG: ADP-forming succinate--CoA ligase subunit beta [Deltaproteobacteria bacterium]|nr:ADP-forming succinate--CoA ligase subunit beta [Deltaproteobacteria bacterium]
MKIHEYQAKQLFHEYGIPIPKGITIRSAAEVRQAVAGLGHIRLIVKAQIHAGGRGKAGGIRIADSAEEANKAAETLIGKRLVTEQTGSKGIPVNHVLIEEAIDVAKELYVGFAIDRVSACVNILVSTEGGMEIEKVAAETPEKIWMELIDPAIGLRPFQVNRIFYQTRLDHKLAREMGGIITNLYNLFMDKDCSLAEINPLIVAKDGRMVALDAKLNFDDNALYRHPELSDLRDDQQENPLEVEATRHHLNYIKLNGNVGCMVNGAGLAMATMDLIKHVGAEPANFLDVGGGATAAMVKEGLKIILSDESVKLVFINIFGGILRCDTLARGVVDAARELKINIPLVIRLEGTNVEEGRRILAASGLYFDVAESLKDAAEIISALIRP